MAYNIWDDEGNNGGNNDNGFPPIDTSPLIDLQNSGLQIPLGNTNVSNTSNPLWDARNNQIELAEYFDFAEPEKVGKYLTPYDPQRETFLQEKFDLGMENATFGTQNNLLKTFNQFQNMNTTMANQGARTNVLGNMTDLFKKSFEAQKKQLSLALETDIYGVQKDWMDTVTDQATRLFQSGAEIEDEEEENDTIRLSGMISW